MDVSCILQRLYRSMCLLVRGVVGTQAGLIEDQCSLGTRQCFFVPALECVELGNFQVPVISG
jgi:hypothetical protein